MPVIILQLPALTDNYIYLIHDVSSQQTAVVDPTLAEPVLNVLKRKNWQLHYIFNTHHHGDHTGGNLQLKAQTGCKIIASKQDRQRIPGIDMTVEEGDTLKLGKTPITVLHTPGHTNGHIVYYLASANALFCGDTLFTLGCGRLFEGTAEQLWASLQKLKKLSQVTKIYCAHEYSLTNGQFALTVEPDNQALQNRVAAIMERREQQLPTVPSTLAEELATNPFFRESSPAIQKQLNLSGKTALEIFTVLRKMKDAF